MKKTVIGLDFDGVIVYNPLRLARAPITVFKRQILKIKKLTFFVPHYPWQIKLWKIIHYSSYFPANGLEQLRSLAQNPNVELHLITARFDYLSDHIQDWLDKNGVTPLFKTININVHNEQPHLFKERLIKKYRLDYFVDDNLNIIEYLEPRVKPTRLFWINNIIDSIFIRDRRGFPYLRSAIEKISSQL